MIRGSADYRSLAAVVAALALVQMCVGALSAFGPLTLIARGEGPLAISAVAACYAAGFLIGARRAPEAIRAIGHIRAFAGFAAFATILALGPFIFSPTVAWMAIQAGIGACVASLLTAGESWIADVAPANRRGAIVSYYLTVSKLGLIAGPLVLVQVAPSHPVGFVVIAAVMAASLIPVCATRRTQPKPIAVEPFGLRQAWRTAPASVIASGAAGAVNGSVLQLYALYAPGAGDIQKAAGLNAAFAIGALIAQWPAGAWSDRIDRRIVIALLAGAAAIVALALTGLRDTAPWPVVLMLAALWGAGSMSFYGIAVAHAADRAAPGQATGMMSGVLVVWAIGAMIGPAIAGLVMASPVGPGGLFLYAAAMLAALAAAMAFRRADTPPVTAREKAPFTVAPATSVAMSAIDPRSSGDIQLDLFTAPGERTP